MPSNLPAEQSPNQFLWPATAERDAAGRLRLGGCDAVDLLARFGSPLYVLDEATLRRAARAYRETLLAHYPPGAHVLYASKALCVQAVLALVAQEGLGVDVVSEGELETALAAGLPAGSLVMQGNNKPDAELERGLRAGVGRVNVDNPDELGRVAAIARRLGTRAPILLRVAPGIEAHTHEFIRTGQEDSKFGFDIKSGQLDAAGAFIAANADALDFFGLQAHIGSQIFEVSAYEETARVMVRLSAEFSRRHGLAIRELDLGGGLGIPYEPTDDPPAIEAVVEALAKSVLAECAGAGLAPPRLVLEPGRSIVGPAGVTLYTVGDRKAIEGVRTYVAVDGGMADNPRPITYGARYQAELANRDGASGAPERVTIAGRYCESGDVLIPEIDLPSPEAGDVLAVPSSGAYTYAMASQYNRVPRAAMVLVSEGAAEVIVARETLADLYRLDRLPDRLRPGGAPCPRS